MQLGNNPWGVAEPVLIPVHQSSMMESFLDDGKNNDGDCVLEARLNEEVQEVGNASILGAGDSARQNGGGDGGLSGGGRLA